MFSMLQLDGVAGLKGEIKSVLDHLMGGTNNQKSWNTWFPHGVSDESVLPRQLCRTLTQVLLKCKKSWEQSEENAKALKEEVKEIYDTLSSDTKRRCLEPTDA